jgi:cell division protein ZapA (FtsZ GTPase activity inhibitor)
MNSQINTTALAFLLALQELDTPLSEEQKKTLAEIADQLDVQPKAWESYTQPLLLEMIAKNESLNQCYQAYKSKLDSLENIPTELLPTATEIEQSQSSEMLAITKGLKSQSEATGYNQQINNNGQMHQSF